MSINTTQQVLDIPQSAQKVERKIGHIYIRIKKHITNVGWLFAGKVLRMAMSMIVGIWVARYLGPEYFGILSYGLAFALLLRPVALFQLEGICVREMVKEPDQKDEIIGSAFILSLVAGIVSYIVVINMISLFKPDETIYCAIVSIVGLGLVFLSFEVFDFWFQANVKSRPVVIARTLVLMVSSGTKVSGILIGAPVIFFAWVNMAEMVLTAAALFAVYQLSGLRISTLKVRLRRIRQLFLDAWPLALSGMAATIYLRIDTIMIGEILGAREVGIYSASTRLAEAWYFLPICIMSSLYPVIIRSMGNSSLDPAKRLQQIYNLMALLGYGVAIVTSLVAAPLVTFLFGQDYQESAQVLSLYIWSGIFVNIAMAKAAWLKAMNYGKIQFLSTLAGALVNVLLNLIFIHRYGTIGAAWATIISYSIEGYLILFLFPSTREQARMITRAFILPVVRLKDIF